MENKTIKHLNTKTWYRFVKVIFILIFLAVLAIANTLVFDNVRTLDQEKTKVSCTYGDKKVFTAKEADLSLYTNDFQDGKFEYKKIFNGYNDYLIRDILNKCYSPEDQSYDVYAMQKVYEIWGDDRIKIRGDARPPLTETEKQYLDQEVPKIEKAYGSDKVKYLDFSVKLFEIKPVFSYVTFIKTFLLTNLIILGVFEAIRRAFYYITLGSLRPQKD